MGVAVVGGLLFVGYTMFPDLFTLSTTVVPSDEQQPSRTDTGTTIDTPTPPEDSDHNAPDTPSEISGTGELPQAMEPVCSSAHGQSLLTLTANDELCMRGDAADFKETET
jgi:hypothetical protein